MQLTLYQVMLRCPVNLKKHLQHSFYNYHVRQKVIFNATNTAKTSGQTSRMAGHARFLNEF